MNEVPAVVQPTATAAFVCVGIVQALDRACYIR